MLYFYTNLNTILRQTHLNKCIRKGDGVVVKTITPGIKSPNGKGAKKKR